MFKKSYNISSLYTVEVGDNFQTLEGVTRPYEAVTGKSPVGMTDDLERCIFDIGNGQFMVAVQAGPVVKVAIFKVSLTDSNVWVLTSSLNSAART